MVWCCNPVHETYIFLPGIQWLTQVLTPCRPVWDFKQQKVCILDIKILVGQTFEAVIKKKNILVDKLLVKALHHQ